MTATLLILASIYAFPSSAAVEKSWEFERFDSSITLHDDGSFTVRETQVVNFQGSFSFLNRDISTEKAIFSEGRTYGRVRVDDIQVFNLDGTPYDPSLWSVESYDGGERIHIEFQAADEQMGWIIEYRMSGAIIFSDEHDRLYWNAVSWEREVPIKSSRVTVFLPEETDMEEVRTDFYVDQTYPPSSADFGREGDLLWWSATDIAPNTTISVDVAFPKGIVEPPYQYRGWFAALMTAASVVLALGALVLMLLLWWKKGRDVGRSELVVVQYEPPQGLRPAMVGMLVNENPGAEDVSATLIDLAIRGKLTVFEEEKGSIFKRNTYRFERRDTDESDLLEYEKDVLRGLFEEGGVVSEDDLKNKFYRNIPGIFDGIKREIKKRKYFLGEPESIKKRYLYLALVLAIPVPALLIFLSSWLDLGYYYILIPGFVLAGLITGIVGHYMPRRSKKGTAAYEHALGFKEFMKTAERDELGSMTPETFQENLPYAMVLEVADSWSRKFEDIYTTPPEWYQGSYATFSTVYLAGSLSSMSRSMSRTMTSSPSSSGGGGGGFGGGFSGGGFGGGGSSAG